MSWEPNKAALVAEVFSPDKNQDADLICQGFSEIVRTRSSTRIEYDPLR